MNAETPSPASGDGVGFTVAITVWRREHLLPHALQSVLRQELPCGEVVVLSDGRSRMAREVVDVFAERLPIRYLRLRRRRKRWGNHLRRRALEAATTSHVVIVGHDCLLYPPYLATHRANLGDDPDGLSVVPVDYWRQLRPDGRMPRHGELQTAGEGEVDLLCLAWPRRLALEADCFGDGMLRRRCADFLSFRRLRRRKQPVYSGGEPVAAHF